METDISRPTGWDPDFYCKRRSAWMLYTGCILIQTTPRPGGDLDQRCVDCEQGAYAMSLASNEPEQRVCIGSDCPMKDTPQPLENFNRIGRNRTAIDKYCRTCRSNILVAGIKNRKKNPKPKTAAESGSASAGAAVSNAFLVTLDFTQYKNLLASLRAAQVEQFRESIEMQILFYLHQIVQKEMP